MAITAVSGDFTSGSYGFCSAHLPSRRVALLSSLAEFPCFGVFYGLAVAGHEDAVLSQPGCLIAGDVDVPAILVDAGVEHGRGDDAGGGDEALDLLGLPVAFFEPRG